MPSRPRTTRQPGTAPRAGSLVAGATAYVSLRFLTRYFETRTLNPFSVYCVAAGTVALVGTSLAGQHPSTAGVSGRDDATANGIAAQTPAAPP